MITRKTGAALAAQLDRVNDNTGDLAAQLNDMQAAIDHLQSELARAQRQLVERDAYIQMIEDPPAPASAAGTTPTLPDDTDTYLPAAQAARVIGVSQATVYRARRENRIRARCVGGGNQQGRFEYAPSTYVPKQKKKKGVLS